MTRNDTWDALVRCGGVVLTEVAKERYADPIIVSRFLVGMAVCLECWDHPDDHRVATKLRIIAAAAIDLLSDPDRKDIRQNIRDMVRNVLADSLHLAQAVGSAAFDRRIAFV